jgi:hypothetical protein
MQRRLDRQNPLDQDKRPCRLTAERPIISRLDEWMIRVPAPYKVSAFYAALFQEIVNPNATEPAAEEVVAIDLEKLHRTPARHSLFAANARLVFVR